MAEESALADSSEKSTAIFAPEAPECPAPNCTHRMVWSRQAYHGGVWFVEEAWVIHLRAEDPPEVKRFTLLHEAFHIACRTICPAFRRHDLRHKQFNEILADYFAACVLMPKKWVAEYWVRVHDIAEMGRIFRVPEQVMGIWLGRTGALRDTAE